MNSKIQVSDHEIEKDENMVHHYMHVCNPSKESHHDHHDHDHKDNHHHNHHGHEENEYAYCCGHHEHHDISDDFEDDDVSYDHNTEHHCFGIHMHGEHRDGNNHHEPFCGMMHGNVPFGMPLAIELEDDDDDDKDCDKIDDILKKIEKRNPEILKLMAMYGIPYPAAKKLLKRIIKATLQNK